MELPTLDGLLKQADIPPTLLDQGCSEEHLKAISLFLDWRRVAPHLGLETTDIEEIESKKTDSEKRLETLQKWKMKYSYLATFKVLVQVLLKVGCADHVLKVCQLLRSQVHTGSRTVAASVTPSPSVQPRASLLATAELNTQSLSTTTICSGQPRAQGSPITTMEPSAEPPSTMVKTTITTESSKEKMEKEIEELEDQFFTVVCKASSDLELNVSLSMVKLCITQLPVSLKHQHIKFLQENRAAIENAESVLEIFSILSPRWNFLNCRLLNEIVRKLGSYEIKQLMERYTEKLREFRMKTKLSGFVITDRGAQICPSNVSELNTLMGEYWCDHTLEELDRFRIELAYQLCVEEYALPCKKIKLGSISVTWALPDCLPGIADKLQYIFPLLKEKYGVLMIEFQGKHIPELSYSEALLKACAEGRLEDVTALLGQETDVNTRDPKVGNTALIKASSEGHTSIVKELLMAQADVNMQNEDGDTALSLASWNGNIAVVKELLAFQANVNVQDNVGNTALIKASSEGHTAIVKELLMARADVNMQNEYDDTALHWASYGGHFETVKDLLESGADINTLNNFKVTALMEACSRGHNSVAILLIRAGTQINFKSELGSTALSVASRMGMETTVIELHEKE